MNVFLRAIGFSDYTDINLLLNYFNSSINESLKQDDDCLVGPIDDSLHNNIYQFTNMLPGNIGINFYVTKLSENDSYHIVDILPFVVPSIKSSIHEVNFEKKYQGFSYLASCEHANVGVSIIFRLSNPMEYLSVFDHTSTPSVPIRKASFSALSIDGTVLLPISQTDNDIKRKYEQIARRSNLVASARTGDETAIQSLAFEDMDTYAKLSTRIRTEDIYTIVESSFMPFGLETDLYSIIAEIIEVRKVCNMWTNEEIYVLTLDYNGMYIETAINKSDIIGEPLKGRRFKGAIWLQGEIELKVNLE